MNESRLQIDDISTDMLKLTSTPTTKGEMENVDVCFDEQKK